MVADKNESVAQAAAFILRQTVACAQRYNDTRRTNVGGRRQLNYFTVTLLTLCR